jgi:hypothetical protein
VLRSSWSPAAILLVLLMGVGSIVMWIGVPVGLIYLASHIAKSPNPSIGPYLVVLLGLPVGMAVVGKALGFLDRAHARLTRTFDDRPHQATWLRSMRGERGSTRRAGILDKVMIVSVAIALVTFGIWFFGFAGSSLPGT